MQPIDIRLKTLFQHQYQYRTHITDKVECYNKKTYVSSNTETSDETFEKERLKTEIYRIKGQTLQEQPCSGRQFERIVIEGYETKCQCTASN